jgi:hypothetical protein
MNIYNSPVTKIAFWVIVIGGAACLLIPLFAPLLPLQYLKGYGEIGDVLGGISSPFLQILGSVLLFLVLKAQIDANGILHQPSICSVVKNCFFRKFLPIKCY